MNKKKKKFEEKYGYISKKMTGKDQYTFYWVTEKDRAKYQNNPDWEPVSTLSRLTKTAKDMAKAWGYKTDL
jgi:hypothetical protein